MHEVDPDEARRHMRKKPEQVIVIQPNNRDEAVADDVAQSRGPKSEESGKRGIIRRFQLEDHDCDRDREHAVGKPALTLRCHPLPKHLSSNSVQSRVVSLEASLALGPSRPRQEIHLGLLRAPRRP